jgi:prepilin-type N-terminal cleavage/methylation domain-containing protein/prepilin-type processing-associated H-X9-DG protein
MSPKRTHDVVPLPSPSRRPSRAKARRAFSLIELLVVIGIIALLIGMLMPALRGARVAATSVACKSNLSNIGKMLLIYANNNRGVLYPIGSAIKPGESWPGAATKIGLFRTLGNGSYMENGQLLPPEGRWPAYVFDPPVWNPKLMICPNDPDVLTIDSAQQHSYLLNHHMEESPDRMIRYGGRIQGYTSTGEWIVRTPSKVVLMGEKRTVVGDYYMEAGDFDPPKAIVEPYRHGVKLGSNYLYLDWHVDTVPPEEAKESVDPWSPLPGQPIPH